MEPEQGKRMGSVTVGGQENILEQNEMMRDESNRKNKGQRERKRGREVNEVEKHT